MVQVKTFMLQPLRRLKVRGNFSTGGDFNDENVATGTAYDGVEHQHVKTVGSYHDHQQCVTCSDVAQMVPKQVNFIYHCLLYLIIQQHLFAVG